MAGQMIGSIDAAALGAMHDAQLDYYGRRSATATETGMVYVYDMAEGQQPRQTGQLKGHEGPVWKVCWAHPKFGSVLASCSYDMKVIVWKEVTANNWQIAYMDASHAASVNDIQFSPYELGLNLACASSDGTISVLSYGADTQWRRTVFPAHPGGARTVSWASVTQRVGAESAAAPRLASGGDDGAAHIWRLDGEAWVKDQPLLPSQHTDAVRAVAWRPDVPALVATGSWDKTVTVWTQDVEGQPWRRICKLDISGQVESLSWSHTGGILAVSFGEGQTSLYKEGYSGTFEEIGKVAESGFAEVPNSITSQPAAAQAPPAAQAPASTSISPGPPPAVDPASQQQQEQQQAVMSAFAGMM